VTDILRASIDRAIKQGELDTAWGQLYQMFHASPNSASAQFVLDRAARIDGMNAMLPCRLALLRSYTLEPLVPLLRAEALFHGINLDLQIGKFNTFAQDILDPGSELYKFDPQIVFLAVQARDLLPDIWNHYTDLTATQVVGIIERTTEYFDSLVKAFRSHSTGSLVLHNFELPAAPSAGILDAQTPDGQAEAIREINKAIRRMAPRYPGVYVLDYDALIARFGRLHWYDEGKWLTMRMPVAADCLIHLADEYLRFIRPIIGKVCKVLVVDLDNTLWGGIIGEDGPGGIKLGAEYPGAAYLALQRAILDVYNRGVILAICSKNNFNEALEVLERHPAMLLRPQHFAAMRINWNNKEDNLREIAIELNLGLDALAFLDDNPAERERIRSVLSQVYTIELPPDPMAYAGVLRACPVFERLVVSAEDRERARYYAENSKRRELKQSAASLEDFYRSLQMEAEIAEVDEERLPRLAQLTQKTNQFNLTTRRYNEQQLSVLARDPEWRIYSLGVRDRFGENGVVGLAMAHQNADVWEIDNFLLSCRVIGRTLETALLAHLAEKARKEGVRFLRGWYFPTKKNAPASNLYPSHSFKLVEERDGSSLWEFDLGQGSIDFPEWISCRDLGGGSHGRNLS
jgi:FkbH-like protein